MSNAKQWTLVSLFCFHDPILVKHQIGTKMAIFTTLCQKCKLLEDHVMPVASWCDARKPETLFGGTH